MNGIKQRRDNELNIRAVPMAPCVMEGAAYWVAFYRHNPDMFLKDYLHLRLKWFQKILLIMMFWAKAHLKSRRYPL